LVIKFITLGYAGFFVIAGINHFINPIYYDNIVPDFIPFPRFVHLFTGVIEIILPLLFFTKYRKEAALFMIAFLVILYIGNLNVWINDLPYGSRYLTNTQHFYRLLLQFFYIGIAYIIYLYE
tara:strand:- start:491 stop:856 length:366 start_codon:yes stop_codon:yes gene_type:complete